MTHGGEHVQIHYLRPPDRTEVFRQALVHRTDEYIVTFLRRTPLARPVKVGTRVVLEDGSPVIWFTYPDRMYDIGTFHDRAGTFTGWYANLLTPVHFHTPLEWETTDLFLDVWVGADGRVSLLDQEELHAAVADGSIERELAAAARAEALRLVAAAREHTFPPPEVHEWPLQRVLAVLGTGAGPAV